MMCLQRSLERSTKYLVIKSRWVALLSHSGQRVPANVIVELSPIRWTTASTATSCSCLTWLTRALAIEYENGYQGDALIFVGQRGQHRWIVVEPEAMAKPNHIRAALCHAADLWVRFSLDCLSVFQLVAGLLRRRDALALTFDLRMEQLRRRRQRLRLTASSVV